MAGHDLLPGCTTPWRHDCPGYRNSPQTVEGPEFATGGMVCHCPCHALERRIAELEAAPPDEQLVHAALPAWLDRIAPSIGAFVAWTVVTDWPRKARETREQL